MKSLYNFSKKEKCYFLFGLLLGDGCLSKNSNWITINHTNKQREYVKFLCALCHKTGLEYKARFDYELVTTYGTYMYSNVRIKIPSTRHFRLNNRFYDENNKKIVSEYVLSRISPMGLMLWFMDDGCLSVSKKPTKTCRQATLATHGFSLKENELIQKVFRDRFDINVKIHKDRQLFKLYFSATDFRKFIDVIRVYLPLIPKNMRYKFDMKYELSNNKNSKSLFFEDYTYEKLFNRNIQVDGNGEQPEMVEDMV